MLHKPTFKAALDQVDATAACADIGKSNADKVYFSDKGDTRFCGGVLPIPTDPKQYKGACTGDSGGPAFLRGSGPQTDEVSCVAISGMRMRCEGQESPRRQASCSTAAAAAANRHWQLYRHTR